MNENAFRLYWQHGETEVIYGETITHAFNKHYGGGAICAVDWFDYGEGQTHKWDNKEKEWVRLTPVFDPVPV